jgi:hypothetical protein
MHLLFLILCKAKFDWAQNFQGPMLTRKKDLADVTLVDQGDESGETILVFNSDKKRETQAFKNLLHAIYNESYNLEDTSLLFLMTELADYYMALPALSKSVIGPLMASNIRIARDALILIEFAVKLRHAPLFQDCVIYLAGRWSWEMECDHITELEGKCREIVFTARNEIYQAIAKSQQIIIRISHKFPAIKKTIGGLSFHDRSILPSYYRQLSNSSYDDDCNDYLHDAVYPLVRDNLFFKMHYCSGQSLYENYFLCADVNLDDLLWKWEESYFH